MIRITNDEFDKYAKQVYDNDHFRYNIVKEQNCKWNTIYSSRNDGKSTGVMEEVLRRLFVDNSLFCYIRRFEKERSYRKVARYFSEKCTTKMLNLICQRHYPQFDTFFFETDKLSNEIYVAAVDENGNIKKLFTAGYFTSLERYSENKSGQYPNVRTFLYEEFLATDRPELDDEFEILMNVISTYAREEDFIVICVGNSLNRRSSIFDFFDVNTDKIKVGELLTFAYTREDGQQNTLCVYHVPASKAKEKNSINFYFGEKKRTNVIDSEWYVADYPPADNKAEYRAKFCFIVICKQIKLYVYLVMYKNKTLLFISNKREFFKTKTLTICDITDVEKNWLSYEAADKIIMMFRNFVGLNFCVYSDNFAGDDFKIFLQEMRRL